MNHCRLLNKVENAQIEAIVGQMLVEDGRTEGIELGIRGLVETYKELGLQKKAAAEKIIQKFGRTEEEAWKTVEEYWN